MPTETLSPTAGTDRVTLYYREGSSDKIYQTSIEPRGGGFVVTFAYGRRGSTLATGTKTAAPVDLATAKKIFDKLVKEKTAKGYTPGEDGTPYQHTDKRSGPPGYCPSCSTQSTKGRSSGSSPTTAGGCRRRSTGEGC